MNPFLSLSLSPSLFSPIYTRLPGRCSLDNKDFRLDSLLFGRLYADNGRFSPLRSTTKLLFTVFPPKLPWNTFQSCNWSAWLFKSIPQHYFYRYLDCKIYTCICFLSVYTCMWMHIYMYIYIYTSTINLVALPSVMKVDWVAAELIEFFFRPRLRPNQQLSGEFG